MTNGNGTHLTHPFRSVFTGIPTGALAGRRYRFRYGNVVDLEDSRGVPGQDYEHLFGDAVAEGVGHGGGAVQRYAVCAPASREHGRVVPDRQRGPVRHLLPYAEADQPDLRRPQPLGLADHVRRDHVPPVPGSAECRPPQAGRQHGPVPQAPFLHARVRAADGPRQPIVPGHERARAHPTNVRRQEHDGRLRPEARPLPHRGRHIQVGTRVNRRCPIPVSVKRPSARSSDDSS